MPLWRTRLSLSAMVVGTLAPDFEYLIRLAPISSFSHTLAGLFLFCLPIGFLGIWLWHALLKQALVHLLPTSHQKKLLPLCGRFRFGPASHVAVIALSVLLGACTHVAWDSFTHSYGPATKQFSMLRTSLIRTPYGSLKFYKLLQHGSTLVGLAVLVTLYMRWYARAPVPSNLASPALSTRARLGVVSAIVATSTIISLAFAWVKSPPWKGFNSFCTFVVTSCILGMSTLGVGFIVFSVWWFMSGRVLQMKRAQEIIEGG